MKWEKQYVTVKLRHDKDGNIRPLQVTLVEAGEERTFPIDRLKHICQAASTKVGGTGTRYTVMIRGRETYLFHEFFEDEGRWFMEMPVYQD